MRNSFNLLSIAEKELEGSSDRAAVIVGGAIIDEVLRDILESFLLKEKEKNKEIFSGNGPLATFSAKITMAYLLGLISKWERDRIDTIRKIRNDFAHGLETASFSNQSIKDRCASLKVPLEMIMPRHFPLPDADGEVRLPSINEADIGNPRSVFLECIFVLISCLAARWCLALDERRTEAVNFSAAHESIEVQLDSLTSLQEKYRTLSEQHGKDAEDQSGNDVIAKTYRLIIAQTKAVHGIKS